MIGLRSVTSSLDLIAQEVFHLLRTQVANALTGLHETMHLAGRGYSDKVLAQEVFARFGNAKGDPYAADHEASLVPSMNYGGMWGQVPSRILWWYAVQW